MRMRCRLRGRVRSRVRDMVWGRVRVRGFTWLLPAAARLCSFARAACRPDRWTSASGAVREVREAKASSPT